jgi:acyl transferase domain-containing protein
MDSASNQNEYEERLKSALLALQKARLQLETLKQAQIEPIAILGIGCRYPGNANDPESFWNMLVNGFDAITEVPVERWDIDAYYDPDLLAPGKICTRWGGFLRDIDKFDSHFFGISPREALSMDPQQRLLMEVSWNALEHANQNPSNLGGSQTGVFVGVTVNDYVNLLNTKVDQSQIDAYHITGNALNSIAGRLSYSLGFQGPSLVVDTACSSSLVAIHLACQSLRSRECNLALAGGVNLILSPEYSISASKANMLAPDGRCKTFDARADGFVRSEGCGVIILKRLSDARADGDNILAVILGSAVNHGGFSSGLTVPNKLAQEALIRSALKNAGVEPAKVQYVEAHGTGTSLGDPIEVRALASVFSEGRSTQSPFWLGSVKTNIGHAESASGVAGLIKTVLALHHEEIPPHLHFETPTSFIDWEKVPVVIPTKRIPWTGSERIAGVSGFGATGTNAHIVLAPAPAQESTPISTDRPLQVLTLSAKSSAALIELAKRYAELLTKESSLSLADLCFTANTGRASFNDRLAVTTASLSQLREQLVGFANGREVTDLVSHHITDKSQNKIAFLFTGQGSQYVGMARRLYETESVFREALDKCDSILRPHLESPLLEILYSDASNIQTGKPSLLDQTAYTQPALFAIEYALAKLWQSWGVTPSAVLGHSVGEYVAACIAGVFSLEDGLKLIAERGRLMQSLPQNGSMAAIFTSKARVQTAISSYGDQISISAINGPDSIVISGMKTAVDAICNQLKTEGIKSRSLEVSHAFHSSLMEPILDQYEQIAAQIHFHAPQIPLASNLSGEFFKDGEAPNASYWRKHTRQAVRFSTGIEMLHRQGIRMFLEIGPSPSLIGMGQRIVEDEACLWLPSLREGRDDWSIILKSLGDLYAHGFNVDWKGFDRSYPRQHVRLPTYPFQRQSYWIKPSPKKRDLGKGDLLHPLLGWRLPTAGQEIIFENELSSEVPAFLKDHVVHGQTVAPASAYVELALAAAKAVIANNQDFQMEDLIVYAPLKLSPEETITVQTIVNRTKDDELRCQIYSQDKQTKQWQQHASAVICSHVVPAEKTELTAIESRCDKTISTEEHYQKLAGRGLVFGPAFRGVTNLRLGKNDVLARVEPSRATSMELPAYHLHPAVLDAALQATAILIPDETKTYLPMSVNAIKVYGQLPRAFWSHTSMAATERLDNEILTTNVNLIDDDGHLLVSVEGFSVKSVASTPRDSWLYETRWEKAEPQSRSLTDTRTWMLLTGRDSFGEGIIAKLNLHKQTAISVYPGDKFAQVENGEYEIRTSCPDDFDKLIQANEACNSIVYLWALNEDSNSPEVQSRLCGGLLHLVQALISAGRSVPIWVVTRGAQAVNGMITAPHQATLWGLCKVINQEHPEISCRVIDLDPDPLTPEEETLTNLWNETQVSDVEDQVAFRNHERMVARLTHVKDKALPSTEPVELTIRERGALESLTYQRLTRKIPGPGEVEIQVHATGIGFRDVLNTLGMYPGGGDLGAECAGIVSAVGEDVQNVKVGDTVIAVALKSFASYVITPALFVAPKPAHLTFAEAATIPSAFLTTQYALHHRAKIKAGDRILIHAAAGGVGMAAVQLALQAGAEIFGTAGSPAKRAILKAMGVQHVFDSRTLNFADEIMRLTDGRGVDLVLNSLANEFITKSVSVLAENGRFIEIGKRDILSNEEFDRIRPNAFYAVIDLLQEAKQHQDLIQSLFHQVMPLFESRILRPLPLRVYPAWEVVDAFRTMAQGRHTGKLVISQKIPQGSIRNDATYLITGGLGGLGISVAETLIQEGARHLVLIGRGAPPEQVQPVLNKWLAAGVDLKIVQANVSNPEQMHHVLAELAESMPPLKGVVHAAGVLDDGVLRQQSWDRFITVFTPKVQGAWYLHELTKGMALDFFVLFSSAVTLIGSTGQANYAAANAFLDALANYRRAQGLPGLSIGWGPWSQVGMAADRDIFARLINRGVDPILPVQGIEMFSKLIASNQFAHVGVVSINWGRFAAEASSPFFANFKQGSSPAKSSTINQPEQSDLWKRIESAPESRRKNLMLNHVREQVIRVLNLPTDFPLEQRQSLQELGMDSLMAVELRNALGKGLPFTRTLPATLAFDYPTPEAMTQYLLNELFTKMQAEKQVVIKIQSVEDADLSDEEAEALLLEELDDLKQKNFRNSSK